MALQFSTVLKEEKVTLTGGDGITKDYKIKELTAEQRTEYNKAFDIDFEIVDQKAKIKAGKQFKMFSDAEFLALCFYDSDDKLVPLEIINKFPSAITKEMTSAAKKLSGMDQEAAEAAKNA